LEKNLIFLCDIFVTSQKLRKEGFRQFSSDETVLTFDKKSCLEGIMKKSFYIQDELQETFETGVSL
jgi:hypothetical protein